MIRVIHIKDAGKYPGIDVYIGRAHRLYAAGPLRNPFPMTSERDRYKVIEKFSNWLKLHLSSPHPNELKTAMNTLFQQAQKQDINLMCWCSPKACHGTIIQQTLNQALLRHKKGLKLVVL